MGCPYKARDRVAPWQWGIQASDVHHEQAHGPHLHAVALLWWSCFGIGGTNSFPSSHAATGTLLLRATARIAHHQPPLPRTQQSSSEEHTSQAEALFVELPHRTVAARGASVAAGGQESGSAAVRSAAPLRPHRRGKEGRTGHASAAQHSPGRLEVGRGRAGPSRAGGAESGRGPPLSGGAEPPPAI